MDNQGIKFDDFINEFYSNMTQQKMILQVDIENSTKNSDTTIYDIHCMLLELFTAGIKKFKLDFVNNLEESICNLQYFFNNININLNIINYSKKELIASDGLIYISRYINFKDLDEFIINSQHIHVNDLEDIKSFYLINTDINICISFEHTNI